MEKRYTVSVLVKNQFGVLNRVTSMFRRRQFNISSLTVSETESNDYSRITVMFDGEENKKQQIINQLYKLPDVSCICELDKKSSVSRELLLIKMKNDPKTRDDILTAGKAFEATTVDYAKQAIILQITGDSEHIDDFIDLMRDYEILEICRTGIVSLQKGDEILRNLD